MFPEINWDKTAYYSPYELQKAICKRQYLYTTLTIQSRLIQIINILKNDNKYARYHYLLPEMKFINEGKQKEVRISINPEK